MLDPSAALHPAAPGICHSHGKASMMMIHLDGNLCSLPRSEPRDGDTAPAGSGVGLFWATADALIGMQFFSEQAPHLFGKFTMALITVRPRPSPHLARP